MSHEVKKMNQPSKKQFFEYMSDTFGYEFSCERAYELLKDVIREANNNQGTLKEFEELKTLNKQDSSNSVRAGYTSMLPRRSEMNTCV